MAWRAELDEERAKELATKLQKNDILDEELSNVLSQTAQMACSRRSCVYLLESGAVSAVIELLIERAAVPRPHDPVLLQVCNTLALLCRTEPECAVAVGLAEGHPVLQRLMTQCLDEEVQEVAAAVALECSRSRGGFPLRRVPLGGVSENVVLPWRVVVSKASHSHAPTPLSLPLQASEAGQGEGLHDEAHTPVEAHTPLGQDTPTPLGEGLSAPVEGEGGVQLLLQRVGVRMGSQWDTGFTLWPAAIILARYLLQHTSLVSGKRVVEVGSGLGLCGLTAAQLSPKHVMISEANDACLHAIHDAIQLNNHSHTGGDVLCEAKWLDWDHVYPLSSPHTTGETIVGDSIVGDSIVGDSIVSDATSSESGSEREGEREGTERGCRVGGGGGEGGEAGGSEVSVSMRWGREGWVCGPMETLLASDVIHDESCAKGLARLIRLALHDDGVALVLAPCPQHRYGVDTFPKHLKAQGLQWEEEAMGGGYVQGVKDADVMRFTLFLINQPKKAPPTC